MNIGFINFEKDKKEEQEFRYSQSEGFESDTDPEQMKKNSSNYQFSTKNKVKKNNKNPFEEFIEDLPNYEYDQKKIRKNQQMKKKHEKTNSKIPLNFLDTNNNRFINYYEAFLYIAEHCQKNGQRFTKETCKEYLKKCYILDFAHDNFIPIMTHLTQKLFNKYFRFAQRELKFL